jgi:hypothetical protein
LVRQRFYERWKRRIVSRKLGRKLARRKLARRRKRKLSLELMGRTAGKSNYSLASR